MPVLPPFIWLLIAAFAAIFPGRAYSADSLHLYTADIPGHASKSSHEPGMALEITRVAAVRADIELEEHFVPWPRAMRIVETRPSALIIPISRTPVRENRFTWIEELYSVELGFISLVQPINDKDTARKLERVGVWRGTSMESELWQDGFKNIVAVSNDMALAKMLTAGRFDAWYGSLSEAAYQFRDLDVANREKIRFGRPVHSDPIWLAGGVSLPGSVVVRLQAALQSMRRDGIIRAITKHYEFDH